jgi:D-alanine-D-alanine ligase
MQKQRVAVIFGGRSGEHVVSLRSAVSVMDAIDRERFEVVPVGITREGAWLAGSDAWLALWEQRNPVGATAATMLTDPAHPGLLVQSAISPTEWSHIPVDVAFPVLHGTYGEDGSIQGLLEMAGIPYVGSGTLASSTAMDKVVMKELFKQHGLVVGEYVYFFRWQYRGSEEEYKQQIAAEIKFPCFVKPANLGSSVGISKVHRADGLDAAIEEALLYDDKIIVEEEIRGREIECAVLGDIKVEASRPGEVIPCNEFYDYQAKYIDDRSELIVPVEFEAELESRIKELSCKAFKAVEASGLARVDFFVDPAQNSVIVNEINTMPGFTSISMYPKMWEASGIGYRELISRLLELAVERFERRRALLAAPPE